MAVIEPGTSGAAISQGQGQGFAQVFGQSSFDPVAFVERVAAKQEARRLQEIDSELKTREKNAKAQVVVPDGSLYLEDEIYKEVDEVNSDLAKMSALGIDIEGSPQGRAILNKGTAKVKSLVTADKTIQERIKHYTDLYNSNTGKYSLDELETWKQQGLDIKDGRARAKFMLENAPFKEPAYDLNKPQIDLAKTIAAEILEKGDTTITSWPAETVAKRVNTYLTNMPTNELQAYYEEGKKKGKWTDGDSMRKVTAQDVLTMAPYQEVKDEPKASSEFNFSSGGVRMPKDVSIAGKPTKFARVPGGYGEISVKKDGKDLAPMEVIDRNGKTVYFKPATYYVGAESTAAGGSPAIARGRIGVKGKVYGRPGEEKIKPGEDTGAAILRIQTANPGAEVVQEGDKFIVYKPLAEDVIDYDTNDIRFQTAIGTDLNEWLDAEDAKVSKGQKPSGGGKQAAKTVPLSQVKSLVGKPGYEGYSEQELIEYYKSQGYTIK